MSDEPVGECGCGHRGEDHEPAGGGKCDLCGCLEYSPVSDAEPMGDIARLRTLAQAATPGPWVPYFTVHGDPYVLGRPADRGGRDPIFPQDIVATIATGPADYGRGDAEFIAAARDAVERLCNQLDEANKLGQALADALAGLTEAAWQGTADPHPAPALSAWRAHTDGEATE